MQNESFRKLLIEELHKFDKEKCYENEHDTDLKVDKCSCESFSDNADTSVLENNLSDAINVCLIEDDIITELGETALKKNV